MNGSFICLSGRTWKWVTCRLTAGQNWRHITWNKNAPKKWQNQRLKYVLASLPNANNCNLCDTNNLQHYVRYQFAPSNTRFHLWCWWISAVVSEREIIMRESACLMDWTVEDILTSFSVFRLWSDRLACFLSRICSLPTWFCTWERVAETSTQLLRMCP